MKVTVGKEGRVKLNLGECKRTRTIFFIDQSVDLCHDCKGYASAYDLAITLQIQYNVGMLGDGLTNFVSIRKTLKLRADLSNCGFQWGRCSFYLEHLLPLLTKARQVPAMLNCSRKTIFP